MKYILAIALTSQASRPEVGRTLENRNPELRARRVKALDWKLEPSPRSIYDKAERWFEETYSLLDDPAVIPRSVYMNETGVMLSVLNSAKGPLG